MTDIQPQSVDDSRRLQPPNPELSDKPLVSAMAETTSCPVNVRAHDQVFRAGNDFNNGCFGPGTFSTQLPPRGRPRLRTVPARIMITGGRCATSESPQVEVSALQSGGMLSGFLLSGRWPESTLEWVRVLLLAVRIAAVPGLLPTTTVFRVHEDVPVEPPPDAVGLVLAEGTLTGSHALTPGQFQTAQPPGLFVLHPPSETRPSLPEIEDVASGCVLLPGIPYLGLVHRAGWVEADSAGTVITMVTRAGIDPKDDVDTAVLAMLLAA
jgi:hypothetical protein